MRILFTVHRIILYKMLELNLGLDIVWSTAENQKTILHLLKRKRITFILWPVIHIIFYRQTTANTIKEHKYRVRTYIKIKYR